MQVNEEYFDTDDFRELLESYETSIEAGHPVFMDADDLVDIADYYNAHDDYDKAVEAIDYALELYPRATLPNVFKARDALMKGDFEAARQYADNIEEHDDPDYHYLQAELLVAEDRIDEADRYLREYGKTVDADEYQDFVKDCANLYIDYDVNDKAYEWMLRCKADDSDDFKELMARTLFGLGKYHDSERIFNELIDRHPFSKHYWNALASAQFMRQDYSGSVSSSEYAIAIDPHDPEGLLTKANGLFQLENYDEALKYYQRYVEEVPEDEPALESIYMELAFCYSHNRQIDKAIEMLDKAGGDAIDKMVVKGHLLLENERVEEALEAFQTAITMSDSTPSVLLRIIVSLYDNRYLTACYEMFGKYFEYIRATDSEYPDGYAYMALCCYDMGRKSEFLHYLREAVKRNPEETRLVLGFLFPDDVEPKDYYEHYLQHLKQ